MPPKKPTATPTRSAVKRDVNDKSLGRTADDYKGRSEFIHIMKSPDYVIGATKRRNVEEMVYDFETRKMKKVTMDLPDGVKRVFLEIASNACDASFFSLMKRVDPGPITFVFTNDGYLSISNGGLPIPVEPHADSTEQNLILVPRKTFGELRQSTNYDEKVERYGSGRNGFGAKLTNMFSDRFILEIGDSGRLDKDGNLISGQHYVGEWKWGVHEDEIDETTKKPVSGGMIFVRDEATPGYAKDSELQQSDNKVGWRRKTSKAYKGKSFVKIEWLLNFERFGMESKYSENEIGLFTRYILEMSLSTKIPVEINGHKFDFRNLRDFASLIWPEEVVKTAVSQFCWPKGIHAPEGFEELRPLKKEQFIAKLPIADSIVEMQILLLDTPDKAEIISFANSMNTFQGGAHINEIVKKLYPKIIKEIGGTSAPKDKKAEAVKGKSKKKVEEKPDAKKPHIVPSDLKPHISMLVVCRVPDPEWEGQGKKMMNEPTPNVHIDDSIVTTMAGSKWRLTERLMNRLDERILKSLKDTDGKSHGMVKIPGEDANFAKLKDWKMRMQCSLIGVEGESASSYVTTRILNLPGGKDTNGYFCFKGKPMNTSANSVTEVNNNKEFIALKKALGLKDGEDYSTVEARRTLRYKEFIIATDADTDGMHIWGLALDWFHVKWPSLLEAGFVRYLATPIIRATPEDKKKPILRFYDEKAFSTWTSSVDGRNFKGTVKYYKGLGTSEDPEIIDDITSAPTIICIYDSEAKESMELAFNPKLADKRKLWIGDWGEKSKTAPIFKPTSLLIDRKISDIVNFSMTPYTIEALFRSITSFKDGLKKAQRQALYYALMHWKFATSTKEEKTAALGTDAAKYTHYHHGEVSMHETIVHMAQDFIGSNNLSVFKQKGQFGSRVKGGKDRANPRYTYLLPAWWLPFVFDKEMVDLVDRREVDGEKGEPEWLPCDIPIGIINGCRGLATGWSTNIPSHHPIDVIDWLLYKLEDKPKKPDPLIPYFNGFRGLVEIKTAKTKEEAENLAEANREGAEFDEALEDDEDQKESEKAVEDLLQKSQRVRGRSLITIGNFEILNENPKDNTVDLRVTELPIGRFQKKYREWAEDLVEAGVIRDIRDAAKDKNYPNLYMYGVPKDMANAAKLGLIRSQGMSNLVMIDDQGVPSPYKSVEHIMMKYMDAMYDMYDRLKAHRLGGFKESIKRLEDELAIIEAVCSGELKVIQVKRALVHQRMTELKLNIDIYHKIPLDSLDGEGIPKLLEKIEKLEEEYRELYETPAHFLWIDRLKKFRKQLAKVYSAPVAPSSSDIMLIDDQRVYRNVTIEYE